MMPVDEMRKTVLLCGLVLLLGAPPPDVAAGAFDEGSLTAIISICCGRFFNDDYLIIGGGIGFYLVDGVELGVDLNAWTGGDPSIHEITPKVTYVYDNPSHVKPYLGAFYNRTYIDGFEDRNAIGYRAGMYIPQGDRLLIGIGIVYTELQDCSESIYISCSESYSELSVMFSL
jgi:hypothetical protein